MNMNQKLVNFHTQPTNICAGFCNFIKKRITLISDITRMDPIDGLSENYLAVIIMYVAATVVVALYILFIGEMSQSLESRVLWGTYCVKPTHTDYSLGGEHIYDYLRMDRSSFFNLSRMLRNGGSLRDTHFMSIEVVTRNVPSHHRTQCQE